jgi:hypothetical protein
MNTTVLLCLFGSLLQYVPPYLCFSYLFSTCYGTCSVFCLCGHAHRFSLLVPPPLSNILSTSTSAAPPSLLDTLLAVLIGSCAICGACCCIGSSIGGLGPRKQQHHSTSRGCCYQGGMDPVSFEIRCFSARKVPSIQAYRQ